MPEFAEFLLETPEAQRSGPVFKLRCRRDWQETIGSRHVSKVICAIGEAAGVIVQPAKGKPPTDAQGKPKRTKGYTPAKFASAHDLRRAFGERWAQRVMPQVLKELMRHETIDTTMRYYVGRNAQTTAKALWASHANTFANTRPSSTPSNLAAIDVSSTHSRGSVKLPGKDSNLE